MTTSPDDFNPKQAYDALSANIEQPERFAQLFCKAAKKQKSIDEVLKNVIRDLLDNDQKTIDRVKRLQRDVDKEDWRNFIKKVGLVGWSIIMVAIGAAITIILKKYI